MHLSYSPARPDTLLKPPFPILWEDNHILAVHKPAMLPTMGVAEGVPSLLSQAKDYIKEKYSKPGNVYLGIVSRLDAPVTGVTIMARTSKAAARLTEQFRNHSVEKVYWALIARTGGQQPGSEPLAERGTLTSWLRKDERHRRVHVCREHDEGARHAVLHYRMLPSSSPDRLVEIRLETGRKHQIRVQLAAVGFPIIGDRKYGSHRSFPTGIALHARQLKLTHPVRQIPLDLQAPLPKSWKQHGFRQP